MGPPRPSRAPPEPPGAALGAGGPPPPGGEEARTGDPAVSAAVRRWLWLMSVAALLAGAAATPALEDSDAPSACTELGKKRSTPFTFWRLVIVLVVMLVLGLVVVLMLVLVLVYQ